MLTRLGMDPLSGCTVASGAHVNLGVGIIALDSSLRIPYLGEREVRVMLRIGEGVFLQGQGAPWHLHALDPDGAQLLSVLPV